jgi:hypothetical protein
MNRAIGATDEWYTPRRMCSRRWASASPCDVASPQQSVPADDWICEAQRFIAADSLTVQWFGFVWMNPPFGGRNGLVPWLEKFFAHRNGVALVPDRTSAPWWHQFAKRADLILFVGKPNPPRGQSNKLKFLRPDGTRGDSPAQGTALLAVGNRGAAALRNAASAGLGFLARPE